MIRKYVTATGTVSEHWQLQFWKARSSSHEHARSCPPSKVFFKTTKKKIYLCSSSAVRCFEHEQRSLGSPCNVAGLFTRKIIFFYKQFFFLKTYLGQFVTSSFINIVFNGDLPSSPFLPKHTHNPLFKFRGASSLKSGVRGEIRSLNVKSLPICRQTMKMLPQQACVITVC